MRILTAVGAGALIVLCVLRRHDLATAAGAVPPQALGALAALHLASLVARSEAWRLSLAALVSAPPSRAAIHAANAGAFVAGALEAHAALPARVALLRRLATRGLAVLTDVRRRAALALLVGCIVGCGLARVWLVLAVAHLDASPSAAALAFAALGIFGLLPLGPSAPPGALLVVSGGAGAGALAAGLALSATSLAAVLVYAGALALTARRGGRGDPPDASGAASHRGKSGPTGRGGVRSLRRVPSLSAQTPASAGPPPLGPPPAPFPR